ncbi:MAG: fibro-slime domain-containing protein [Phycisphaerales bacterium]|nr:fibro-slime domain-containing protein [Phycisphaerales bacterium]
MIRNAIGFGALTAAAVAAATSLAGEALAQTSKSVGVTGTSPTAPETATSSQTSSARPSGDALGNLPATLELTGVVRDFRWASEPNGHPDFEVVPKGGYGHYMNNVAPTLDADGKPVFVGGGKKVRTQWADNQGQPIHPSQMDAKLGDKIGAFTGTEDNGGISSAASFSQWYRDVPGVNISKPVTITLSRQPNSNIYTFDDRTDAVYSKLGGFFPINGQLFGNSPGQAKNFGFTYEIEANFVYKPGAGQTFTFRGDDDVWVFINGQLVIDIGGVHSAVQQTVYLDRLKNLKADSPNTLKFFFAERHTTQSNFRIDTTLNLQTAKLPNTVALFD